jgi:hypothetical protein
MGCTQASFVSSSAHALFQAEHALGLNSAHLLIPVHSSSVTCQVANMVHTLTAQKPACAPEYPRGRG